MRAVHTKIDSSVPDLKVADFWAARELVSTSIPWSQLRPYEDSFARFLPIDRIAQHGTVLTGPNSAGKTTQIRKLSEQGIETTPEFLRDLFTLALDAIGDQRKVRIAIQVIFETGASMHGEAMRNLERTADSSIVFDRGLGDFHGLLRLVGLLSHPYLTRLPLRLIVNDPDIRRVLKISSQMNEVYQEACEQLKIIESWAKNIRYKQVLYLKPLPTFESDAVRSDDWITTRLIDRLIRSSWKKLGYQLIAIPPYFNDVDSRTRKIMTYL